MNPRVAHVAIVICAVGLGAFVIAMALLGGCSHSLPPEPPIVCTVTASRDAGR